MKGIILAGGTGSRLHPLTISVSKQLLPVYDKPMIYYPLSTLLIAGIRDILFITTPHDQFLFKKLLGDGSQLGCSFQYLVQDKPEGLAQAFILGEEFIGSEKVALILGDNIFYGGGMGQLLRKKNDPDGGIIFAYHVKEPERYGVVEFGDDRSVISIEEKPQFPKSNYAIPGIYFYDNTVVDIAKNLQPSARGEYEITDINKHYLKNEILSVEILSRGTAWLDTGTFRSLTHASEFVKVIEDRQGLKIGCIEEIAYSQKYIDEQQLESLAQPLKNSGYGKYLLDLIDKPDLYS